MISIESDTDAVVVGDKNTGNKDGPDGKSWGQSLDVLVSIHGFANFVYMVNPEKGTELQRRVRRI